MSGATAEIRHMSRVHQDAAEFIATGAHKRCFAVIRDQISDALGVGTHWRHYRSANVYVIHGIMWDANVDEWAVRYRRLNDIHEVDFSKTLASFLDTVVDGDGRRFPRFMQIAQVI